MQYTGTDEPTPKNKEELVRMKFKANTLKNYVTEERKRFTNAKREFEAQEEVRMQTIKK